MYYIIILVLLFLAELFYFRIADKCNIIDKPNERSSHTRITLRGGGIIFYFGVLAYFLTSHFEYPWFMLALTLITFISFVDDIRSTSQVLRLVFHFSAMALMFYQWGLFSLPWWTLFVALIVCTGIINAYNFMDGINGITGGYSLVVLVALAYINEAVVSFVEQDFIYTVLCAVLVFNFFNYRKQAKCFAGDVGAVGIAFIICGVFSVFACLDIAPCTELCGVYRAIGIIVWILVILWTLPPDTWLARFATNNYKRYEDNYD